MKHGTALRNEGKKASVFAIIGPDGSGKTVLSDLLVARMRVQGKKARRAWMRSYNILSLPLYCLFRILRYSKVLRVDHEQTVNLDLTDHPHWFQLLSLTTAIDQSIGYVLKVWIPVNILGYTIVCDRFTWDTVVDLCLVSGGCSEVLHQPQTKALIKAGRCVPTILMTAPKHDLLQRRSINRLDPRFERKIDLYHDIADRFKLPIVENTGPVDDVMARLDESFQSFSSNH